VARLVNNAYNVLGAVHTAVSLSQWEAFVNIMGHMAALEDRAAFIPSPGD
jgi:hypothetical protein